MRTAAKDFTASTIRDTAQRELRLLSQPVYRFPQSTPESDGALFLWLEDWDPELLMLIETRATADGPKWHVSFGRFTNLPIAARHKGKEIWSFTAGPSEPSQGGREHRYISVHGVDVLPAVRDE